MYVPSCTLFLLCLVVVYSYSDEDYEAYDDDDNDDSINTGKCTTDKDCNHQGWDGQECVAVSTSRVGLTKLSQCTPKDTCAGTQPGYCPTFHYWSEARYRLVHPVCVYIEPKNCKGVNVVREGEGDDKDEGDDGEEETTVDCETIQVGRKVRHVIFGCEDVTKYQNRDKPIFPRSVVEAQLANCTNGTNGARQALCSACGTCMPLTGESQGQSQGAAQGSAPYGCRCYQGFGGQFCDEVLSEDCATSHQCGYGQCDPQTRKCVCPQGYRGSKCELCTSTTQGQKHRHRNVCFGNGECSAKGVCRCLPGYSGRFCQTNAKGEPVDVNDSKRGAEGALDSNGAGGEGGGRLERLLLGLVALTAGWGCSFWT